MKHRRIVIVYGQRFQVPDNIQRFDYGRTHCWQVRYGGPKDGSFYDHDLESAKGSLSKAVSELIRRVNKLPAPSGLRKRSIARKKTHAPLGISGPFERIRKGKSYTEWEFRISIPRYGRGSTNKNVYIGTDSTISDRKIKAALAKAREIRGAAERDYQIAATASKQREVRVLTTSKLLVRS